MSKLGMFGFKVLIILSSCLSWSYCKLDKYCSICEDHTMCKFHETGEDCVNIGGSGVTEQEKKEIVDVHNWVRRVVASGYETRGDGGNQPKAANLLKFVWDDELSKVAQMWADQCKFEHDTCRNDPRWKVGQNIYWKWKYPTHYVNWTEAILSWYNEVSLYDPKDVKSYRFESSTGHYTQILWHDTYAIGCGRRDYGQNKLYVCNYGPAGNWISEPLYEIGEPCSQCPAGTVCEELLCVLQNHIPEIETPAETKGLDTNALRTLSEKEISTANNFNETKTLKTVKPPNENATDTFESEKTTISIIQNETKQIQFKDEQKHKVLNDILTGIEEERRTTTNSVNENRIELDVDTKNGIEGIRLLIEQLVKNAIRKLRTKQ